jgi:hypothetical protein
VTFFAKQGTLTVPAATGLQTYTVGFQPTAILYWSSGVAAGDTADGIWMIGMQSTAATGDGSSLSTHAQSNNVASTNAGGSLDNLNNAPAVPQNATSASSSATLSSTSSTGFTLNWTFVQGTGVSVHYLALGGTECLATSKSFTQRTTTGTQAITGVGFQPKLVIFTYSQNNLNGGYGVASSSTSRWACSYSMAGGASMSSTNLVSRIQDTTKCISLLNSGGVTTTMCAADLTTMDADGFTLNWTTATSTTLQCRYLAIGGAGQFATGTFTKSANTTDTTQTINAGLATAPGAYMVFGAATTSNTATQTGWRQSIGGSDGTSYNSCCCEVKTGVINTQARRYSDSGGGANTVQRQRAVPASVSAAGANEVILDHNSFTSSGFVLDYATNAVTTQYIFPWIVFGGAPVSMPNTAITGPADAFAT